MTSLNRRMACGGAIALLVGFVSPGQGFAAPAGNPYNLLDPSTISVGSMGDAKPYAFTDTNGQFSGLDVDLFRDVARRQLPERTPGDSVEPRACFDWLGYDPFQKAI